MLCSNLRPLDSDINYSPTRNRWKEKPVEEYGSEKIEILFKALYNTVNEFAEMAGVEQGHNVRGFLIEQVRVLFNESSYIAYSQSSYFF